MPRPKPWTPRTPEPLTAVLAAAGSFFFLAALGGLGPFQALDQRLWRASQPGAPVRLAETAVRVLGHPSASSGPARVGALAEDLAWLRREGAGAIIIEAWLDEAPQADASRLAQALEERFQFLDPGARTAALQALTETAAGYDAALRLAKALGAAQPLLLAWQAVPGSGLPTPAALRRQGYEVTLRGERQSLPEVQAIHLPWDGALEAVARSGACAAMDDRGRLPAVVELNGLWFNALGLEAARMALGLPLEGLRYRWRQGTLSSLELMSVRYPLDDRGRLRLPPALPALPSLEMDRLRDDAAARLLLRGRAVFYRPWPQQLGDPSAFEEQERLFAALVERAVLAPQAPAGRRAAWIVGGVLGILGLAFMPLWAALPLWSGLPAAALFAFRQGSGLAEPLVLALAGLCIGVAWRLQRRGLRRRRAEASLQGRCAPKHLLAWERRLQRSPVLASAAYAVAGPRRRLAGPEWEAWMQRWGAFLDLELALDGTGLVFPPPAAEGLAVQALDDLRRQLPGVKLSLGFGDLVFESRPRLGNPVWELDGPGKDRALGLLGLAKPGACLILEKDYPAIRKMVQIQITGQDLGHEGSGGAGQVLNLGALNPKM